MIFSVIAALIASVSYGVSDFLGAVAAMRLRVIPTTTISYAAATVALAVAVLITGGQWSLEVLAWGSIAGVCAVVGFATFYAAMARGPMSLASPFVAVLSAAVPIAAAILLGEVLPPLAWGGVAIALLSATLIASQPRGGGSSSRIAVSTILLASLAGVTLGSALIALDQSPPESGLIAALIEMAVGLVLLLLVLALSRSSTWVRRVCDSLGGEVSPGANGSRRRAVHAGIAAGVLLGLSGALMLAALQAGSLAIVSVLIALYPLGTIVLARIVVKERISGVQIGGVGLAIVASAVIGLALS